MKYEFNPYRPFSDPLLDKDFREENRLVLNPEDYSKWVANGVVAKIENHGVIVIASTLVEKGRLIAIGPIAKHLKDSQKR